MKKVSIIIIVGLLVALGAGFSAPQSSHDLFQKALVKERTEGNLEDAIQLYQRIVREFAEDRPLAAKALLQMGQCYEKLGNAEARKAYERLVRDYADQNEVAAQARTRLAALRKPAVRESGMATRRIWAGPDVDILGSVSSDGRYLSYTDWETGDLAIRDLETGKNRRLTNKGSWDGSSEYAEFSAVSPDGKQVAYAWSNKDDSYDLRLIGSDGSKPTTLYVNADVEWIQPATWSPDGKHILATFTRKDGTNQIVLVSVADGSVRVLKTLDWQFPGKTSFSPDGRYIAYDCPASERSPSRDIFLLSTDGKRESPLIEHPANDLYPVWTPDGKRILFASDRTGSLGAWIIQVTDGKPQGSAELVKQDLGGGIVPLGFTREGSFYYGLAAGTSDVYIASLDLKTGKLVAAPKRATERFVGSNSRPDWSPDGRQLAYLSRRGPMSYGPGSFAVCIRSLESGEERDLSPKLSFIFGLRWSPDGRSVLLNANDVKNHRGLYLMDVESGNVSPLVQAGEGEFIDSHVWSPDGRAVFYGRGGSSTKKSSIVVRELETGQERQISSTSAGGVSGFDVSPDGQWVVFHFFDQATGAVGLKVISSTGGVPRELVRVEKAENIGGPTWTRDGLQVLFAKGATSPQVQKYELWRIPAEGGTPQKVGLAMGSLRDMRVHPDGRRIAFTADEPTRSEVWVMENFLPPAAGSPK
jgi:Tol biopolymer transport system component